MLKRALLAGAALIAAGAAVPAMAAGVVVASGTTSAQAPAGATFGPSGLTPVIPFSVPAAGGSLVTVADCCIIGDFYAVMVDGVHIGTTPAVTTASTALSVGTFFDVLAAGGHTIQMHDLGGPFNGQYPAGLSWSVATAPELSTWAMMGIGFAGLAFAGYRSSRKSTALAV